MKKVLLFIFVFSLFIVNVNATKLVSLGDSIPYGYLLDDREDSYDDRLAYTLKLDYYEYSYPGMRSDELLENLKLDEVKDNIKDADIVIINIGANDLLDLTDLINVDSLPIDIESITSDSFDFSIVRQLVDYLNTFFRDELRPRVAGVANDFSIVFPKIIDLVKSYNPDVKIYVNNLYNPFANLSLPAFSIDLSDVENYSNEAIVSFNDIIALGSGYEIVDIYNTLDENSYLNVNPLQGQVDPHPNRAGHQKIYELYLSKLAYKVTYEDETYYVLKGDKLDIKPEKKKGYTFKKWNYDLNNIDKDIELKAIYKKNINYYLVGSVAIVVLLIIVLIIKRSRKK